MDGIVTGDANTAIGTKALRLNTSGADKTAVGDLQMEAKRTPN